MYTGTKVKLKLKGTKKKCKWSVNKPQIISVSQKGIVKAKKKGKAKVLLEKLNINDNYVIINQINNNNIKELIQVDETNKKFFSYIGKGLSKSRNLAINKSTADVIAIADDDMTYQKDYTNIIKEAYEKYKDADIIAFVVEHEDKKDEKKVLREGRIGFLKSMKISSVQMTVNRESILKKSIKFDEDFGAGSKYYMGEENIFLFDCLKKGLKIYYVPKKIAILRKIILKIKVVERIQII